MSVAAGSAGMVLDVPAGFVEEDAWYLVSEDQGEFVGLYSTDAVLTDPCRGSATVTPGPSVDDLVEALVAQRSTSTSRPRPVTLAGHDGVYLEVTGPADLSRCVEGPELMKGRGIYGDAQVDHLWVLDLDGQRVVVDASHGQGTPKDEVDELEAMVASMRYAA